MFTKLLKKDQKFSRKITRIKIGGQEQMVASQVRKVLSQDNQKLIVMVKS